MKLARFLAFCLVVLVLVLTPAAVFAEDKGGHGGGEPGGDILAPRFDLGIWSIIVFVLLLWVLGKFAWGPMLAGLRRREQGIRDAIAEAEGSRTEAQRLREQLKSEFENANLKVRDIMEQGRRDAEQTAQEIAARARAEIQGERDRLRREIDTAKDQALQEIWKQSAQLATLISAKAIRKHLAPDDHRQLVDEALGELKVAGNQWQQGAGSHA
jgi:F-type H+-transporting ATPase subunit b